MSDKATKRDCGIRRLVLAYITVSGAWFAWTDFFRETLAPKAKYGALAHYEDLLFVLVTGILLYVFIRRLAARLGHVSETLRSSEGKYRFLAENSPDGIYINRDNRIAYVNAAAVQLFGARSEKELIGKSIFDLLPPESHEIVRNRVSAMLDGQLVPLVTHKIVRMDGEIRDVEVAATSFEDDEGPGIKAIFRDISERNQKDAEIRRLNRIYSVLSQVNQSVVRVTSRKELFRETCQILVEFGGFEMAWVGSADGNTPEMAQEALAGRGTEILSRVKVLSTDDQPGGRGLIGTSWREGCTCIANDYGSDPRTEPWWEAAAEFGYNSAISLPLRRGGEVCAVLMAYAGEKDYFHSKEVSLLEEVALDISFALENMDREARRRTAEAAQAQALSLLRATLESTTDGILVVDLNKGIVDFNTRFTELWHLSASWSKSKDYKALCEIGAEQLEDPKTFLSNMQEWYDHPEKYGFDVLKFADGRVCERHSTPQRVEGKVVGRVVSFRDVTERVRAAESLKKSEEKFRALFSASRDAILVTDLESYLDCNEAALEMFGCASKEEFCARKVGGISPPTQPDGTNTAALARQWLELAFKTGAARYEWIFQRFDGTEFPAEVSLNTVQLEGRTVIQGVVRDISWRKEAEKQLRQLSRAVEQSPSAVVITDTKGDIHYVNPKFTNVTGYTLEEVLGQNPRVLKSGETPSEGYKELWETVTSGREWHGEFHNRKKNGELFWESASICPITGESGAITHFLAVKEDITERKRTEEALKKSEEKFVKAFNVAPAVVAIITLKEARYLEVNEVFLEITGYTRAETIGHTVLELNLLENPEDAQRLIGKLVAEGTVRNEEYRYRVKSGEILTGLISGELIEVDGEPCIIYISLDITERKQMEEKFLRAQRMESIGALAGGMAHDLNNILAPIMMSASMLREKQLPGETREQLISGIEEAAQRGADIVNQVLTFARGVKGERTVLDTHLLVTQIAKIIKETFPKSIAFSLSQPETIWNISGDSTQLHQVLLNLCVNARDAMPDGGTLELSMENREVDSTFAFMVPGAKPGNYVQFKLADSGTGIPREILDRIFEPFFTTKETGKGTGLGLSMAMGIVQSHGGFLKVESQPGKGSVFQVFLPATTDAAIEKEDANQPSLSRGHGETILVVDDESEILQIIGTVLKQNGWNVVSAADGVEGLAAFLNQSGKINAVVTDMVMPNMDGLSLIRSIRKLAPELPILVSSGYSNEQSRGALGELHVNSFLKKPFSARQLIAEVFDLLYGQAPGPNGK